MRYYLRIALLSFGVLAGYGSAFAHFMHMRHGHGERCGFGSWYDHDHEHDHAAPAKPVH